MTDFSNHPKSLTEIKAERAESCGGRLWTPRDVLIATLREIDSGELDPDSLIVCMGILNKEEPGRTRTQFRQCGPNALFTVGVLEDIKVQLLS